MLASVIDAYLEWVQKNRAAETYEWYRYRLQRFVLTYPESKGKRSPRIIYLTEPVLDITKRLVMQHPEAELFRNSRGRPREDRRRQLCVRSASGSHGKGHPG